MTSLVSDLHTVNRTNQRRFPDFTHYITSTHRPERTLWNVCFGKPFPNPPKQGKQRRFRPEFVWKDVTAAQSSTQFLLLSQRYLTVKQRGFIVMWTKSSWSVTGTVNPKLKTVSIYSPSSRSKPERVSLFKGRYSEECWSPSMWWSPQTSLNTLEGLKYVVIKVPAHMVL